MSRYALAPERRLLRPYLEESSDGQAWLVEMDAAWWRNDGPRTLRPTSEGGMSWIVLVLAELLDDERGWG